MLDPVQFASQPAPGRSCGTCTLCCKVYDVPALEKPAGSWCRHCAPGRGCGIHETRPQHCRSFHCLWMIERGLGDEWKPERCKMVLTIDPVSRYMLVQVDPGASNVWRRDPHHTHMRRWAAAMAPERRHVVVFVNRHATVVLPDRDVPLGVMEPGDRIVSRQVVTPGGATLEVQKVSEAAAA